jgi:hypothetical protein
MTLRAIQAVAQSDTIDERWHDFRTTGSWLPRRRAHGITDIQPLLRLYERADDRLGEL